MSETNAGGRLGVIIGGGTVRDPVTGATSHHLAAMALDRPARPPSRIPLPFLPHGIVRSPNDPDLFVAFEKHGRGASAVDLRAAEVRARLELAPEREFYGHGAFSPDGSRLYCTETDVRDGYRGYIAIRDGRDFRHLGDLPSHGLAPHDCELRDQGRTLVVTHGGSHVERRDQRPCVTWIDVDSGALRRQEVVPDPTLNAGHLTMTPAGGLALVSAPRHGLGPKARGGVSLRGPEGSLRTVTAPARVLDLMVGETLSVAIHPPSSTVAATSPQGHVVGFWALHTGEPLGSRRIPNPRGVALTLDGREFVVTFGATAKVVRLDATTLEVVDAPGNRDGIVCAITGSHVVTVATDALSATD